MIALCSAPNRLAITEIKMGDLLHIATVGGCRAWLVVAGPYIEPAEGREAYRLIEVDESNKASGQIAQAYANTLYMYHTPSRATNTR